MNPGKSQIMRIAQMNYMVIDKETYYTFFIN